MSIALYRKYRPKTFDEICGQDAIIHTLRNQIKHDRISHAYLFSGLRGSGKTSIARIFAKTVNCENPVDGNPCLQCSHCTYQNDVNPDIIEIDAASNNGVDSIRQLIDEVNYKPTNTKYKVYIIDEVHMLSGSAFNALLKTIEEPPSHAIFIMATTELYKVPVTIRSRCQVFAFKNISNMVIKSNIMKIACQEGVDYFNEQCFDFIAEKADGSMRDAISILDQGIANHQAVVDIVNNPIKPLNELYDLFGETYNNIVLSLVDAVDRSNVKDCIDILHTQYADGRDLRHLLEKMYRYYFNKCTEDYGTTESIIYERYSRILGETITALERSNIKMTMVEIAFIKLCKPEMEKDYNSVVQRMNSLEKELLSLKSNGNSNVQKQFDENSIVYYNDIYNHIINIH